MAQPVQKGVGYQLLLALTWPVRVWRLRARRCPWCNIPLSQTTLNGGGFDHLRSSVRYCSAYHFFEYDSLIRTCVHTRFKFEDPYGRLPREAKEVIDALGYAMYRVVFYQPFDVETQCARRDEGFDKAIRSCERLVDRIIESR